MAVKLEMLCTRFEKEGTTTKFKANGFRQVTKSEKERKEKLFDCVGTPILLRKSSTSTPEEVRR